VTKLRPWLPLVPAQVSPQLPSTRIAPVPKFFTTTLL
jgi:hypothetical protein